MIHFACLHCGMKFHVKPEFAGRATRCPTCKRPLQVPDLHTEAFVPGDHIEGTSSSLDQAGASAGVTLAPAPGAAGTPAAAGTGPTSAATPARSVAETLAGRDGLGSRYVLQGEVARGGMGAVLRGIDRDLRREVAVKFMLDPGDPRKMARFIEEAQITGQLEHPNIVPVHELGIDARRRLFFTMKMVRGRSLAQVLAQLKADPAAARPWSLGRLLNVLVNVCHALGYAHARAVIHRDLKPANVMVGDFGEVYVMDWGLAKVLAGRPADPTVPPPLPAEHSQQVATVREAEGDLTQDGAILGTPAYMAPEQACGRVEAIDRRTDVYALGALLYSVLTLEPPVGKAGSHLATLLQVAEGAVTRPEERAPERARRGLIPPELSAVAMRALAKEPKDRYQTVEEFRRDLERYLEGRSVSAKADTAREQLVKFVKRNKAVSAATGLALAVLAVVVSAALRINIAARVEAEEQKEKAVEAFAAYKKEQADKEAAIWHSVPALVRAGRQLVNEGQSDKAGEQVELALRYDPDDPGARLLKAQIHASWKRWPEARAELDRCLRRRPDHPEARALGELLARDNFGTPEGLFALAQLLQQQKVQGLAVPLLAEANRGVADLKKLLPPYRELIERRWPGLGNRLTVTREGLLKLDLSKCQQVDDLSALRGIPLHELSLKFCNQVKDLRPLAKMPLRKLSLTLTQVEDLKPLSGLPLEALYLNRCPKLMSLEGLQGCRRLAVLSLEGSPVKDLRPLRGLPLRTLYARSTPIRDMGILRDFKHLHTLYLDNCNDLAGDLAPLKDLPLVRLGIASRGIRDLRPLGGLKKLEHLTVLPEMVRQGWEVVRSLDNLKVIQVVPSGHGKRLHGTFTAAEFWKHFESGDFKWKPR